MKGLKWSNEIIVDCEIIGERCLQEAEFMRFKQSRGTVLV